MFKVKDSTGQEIYLKDKVRYTLDADLVMGRDEPSTEHGFVIAMPTETEIEVQPEEGGVPVFMPADSCVVTESLVQKVQNLHTEEDLQQLLMFAEERHAQAVANAKPVRKGGTRKASTPKADNPFAK